MKIIDIFPKEICVNIELTSGEVEQILAFFERAIPLYQKVYLDGPIDESELVAEEFIKQLQSIKKAIETEMQK